MSSNSLAGLLPFVLIALVFWFLIVRPQRRRQQALSKTQSALGIGSEVMLTSGIFGRVVSLEDDTLHLEVSPGATIKVSRQAVVRVVDEAPEAQYPDLPAERGDDDTPDTPDQHQ